MGNAKDLFGGRAGVCTSSCPHPHSRPLVKRSPRLPATGTALSPPMAAQTPHAVNRAAATSGSSSGPRNRVWCLHPPSRTYCLRCPHSGSRIQGPRASWREENSEVHALAKHWDVSGPGSPQESPDLFPTRVHLVLLHRRARDVQKGTQAFPKTALQPSPGSYLIKIWFCKSQISTNPLKQAKQSWALEESARE